MNTSEILDRAADLIEERGWTQGWYCGPTGELCAAGAMFVAIGLRPAGWTAPEHPAHRRAMVAFERHLMDTFDYFGAHNWNDEPGRTQAEVVNALRAAARAET